MVNINYEHRNVFFFVSCWWKGDNYFFEIVVPQILQYFKENKEEILNYLMLEVLKKDKQYQEQIENILELSKKEIKENKKCVMRFLEVKALKQYMNYHKKAGIMKEQKINTNLIIILELKIVKIILK